MLTLLDKLAKRLHIIENADRLVDAKRQMNDAYTAYQEANRELGPDDSQTKAKLEQLRQSQELVRELLTQQPAEPTEPSKEAGTPVDTVSAEPEPSEVPSTKQYGRRYTDSDYKNPNKGDRQETEDALYHTIGPLTSSPRWVSSEWSSPGNPPPDFVPGGAAPRWTPEEIIFAMAGDPAMLFTGQNHNPLSPQYGNKGGAPLFRKARQLARQYGRPNDRTLISDLYQNGFIPLLRMMQPGFDEGRSPFISYVIRNIESGMGHGSGGTKQSQAALGIKSEDGIIGFKGLLTLKSPDEIRQAAEQIGPSFRERSGHQKDAGNPLGKYSASFYQLATEYAGAIESNDNDRIEAVTNKINQKIEEIEDENVMVLGASTGVGQAISTPDRQSSVNISSLDAPAAGSDDAGSRVANIAGSKDEGAANTEREENVEIISLMLDRAMKFDFGTLSEKWKKKAEELGAKGAVKFAGPLNMTQLRYTIRTLGESGSNYPGKGNVRQNTQIARESRGWCLYGEDPELEPIPTREGAIWRSEWVRKGYPSIGSTEIAAEMTREVVEFERLGIQTARSVKSKASGKEEVVSKNAVSNALAAAKIKLMILAEIERYQLGIDENKLTGPLLEDIKYGDKIDRQLIAEACDWACAKIDKALNKDPIIASQVVNKIARQITSANKMRPIDFIDYID